MVELKTNIAAGAQWIGQKLHQFRHVVNDVVKLNAPRQELAATLGWQRALAWGSPDWYRAYPAKDIPQLQQHLQEQFAAKPETIRTACTSLSYLLHAANDPCHHHTPEEAAQHEAKKDEAHAMLGAITEALTEHTGFVYHNTSLLRGGTFGLGGGIKVPGQADPVDAKALALLKYLATEHDGSKGLLSRWHFETARAVAAPKEKGLLNNPVLNVTAAVMMTVGGGAALAHTAQQAVRPLEPNETVPARAADIASTAAIVLGAFPYGKAVSLLEKNKRTTQETRRQSNNLMSVHGASEVGVTGGNTLHVISTSGTAASVIGVKEITDSMADFLVTPKAVDITNNAQDAIWDMVERRTGNTSSLREKHRHNVNGIGAVLGTAALSNVNMALATPLLVGYGAIYAATLARKLPGLIRQGAERAANAIRPRAGFVKGFGAGVAATVVAATGFLGLTGKLPNPLQRGAPSQQPVPEVATSTQARNLLAYYTSPQGETLQELQKRGGSAAEEVRYKPSDPARYMADAARLTGLPATTMTQAKENVAAYTDLAYRQLSTSIKGDVPGYFQEQYRQSNERTPVMIQNVKRDLHQKTAGLSGSTIPDTENGMLLVREIKAFQQTVADGDLVLPKTLDAVAHDLTRRALHCMEQGHLLDAEQCETLRGFLVQEIFERGNNQIIGGDILRANVMFARFDRQRNERVG